MMTASGVSTSVSCGESCPGETVRYGCWSFMAHGSEFGIFITFAQHAIGLYAGLCTVDVDNFLARYSFIGTLFIPWHGLWFLRDVVSGTGCRGSSHDPGCAVISHCQ